MNINTLKYVVVVLVISVSHYANAGLIIMSINDNGTDLTMTATGDYDNTGLINQSGLTLGVNAAIAGTLPIFGWETNSSNNNFNAIYSGTLTANSNAFPASSVSTTTPFFFANIVNTISFSDTASLIGTVSESAIFENTTLASLGMISGESITVSWGENQAIIQTNLAQIKVSETSAIAMFFLGIVGFISRKFNNNNVNLY